MTSRSRTLQQNKALHVYIRLLAEALASSGYDMREVKIPILPTEENVKEAFLKPVMSSLYPSIKSTKELNTEQISELYEVLNYATATKLGISIEFPSEESMNVHKK